MPCNPFRSPSFTIVARRRGRRFRDGDCIRSRERLLQSLFKFSFQARAFILLLLASSLGRLRFDFLVDVNFPLSISSAPDQSSVLLYWRGRSTARHPRCCSSTTFNRGKRAQTIDPGQFQASLKLRKLPPSPRSPNAVIAFTARMKVFRQEQSDESQRDHAQRR